jgi:putative transposase
MASQFRTRDYKPYGLVHITARGFKKRIVFADAVDRDAYMSQLRTLLNGIEPAIRPKLLSCAQMPNHVHLLFQHGRDPLAVPRLMRALSVKYAQYFNHRHGLTGAVWQKPFRGRVVRGGGDLINVVTYIHLNRDSTTRDTNSSHPIYLGKIPPGIVNTDLVLKAFGGRAAYAAHFANTAALRAARAAAKTRINK